MNTGNRRLIGVAKVIIVILIILLVLLALWGVRKIGDIFKTDTNTETSSSLTEETEIDRNMSVPEVEEAEEGNNETATDYEPTYLLDYEQLDLSTIPDYCGDPFVYVNNGEPQFTENDKANPVFEQYSVLDYLGRCGVATANLGLELMPTEERGSIGNVKPSGWHTVKYPELIEDRYLYNRCHLIAFCLAGENDNEKNLITGTRYMNVTGMLPFENDVAKYIEYTGNHVLYRVTPCFYEDELVARGVQMEAWSVEDNGLGICFNVFVYNVQPGISIDYATGDSWVE